MKANRMELVKMVKETIESNTYDPADEIIAMGEALVAVGKSLQGLATPDARRVMKAVALLTIGDDD